MARRDTLFVGNFASSAVIKTSAAARVPKPPTMQSIAVKAQAATFAFTKRVFPSACGVLG
jgi:hypothetical protein